MNRRALLCLLMPLTLSCRGEVGPDPIVLDLEPHCEATGELHCLLPWPSDQWLVEDAGTATGYRLEYDELAFPVREGFGGVDPDLRFDVSPYRYLDGFSPASHVLTVFSEAIDASNLPGEGDWDASVAADSPTVLLDLETGQRVPHMVEVDLRAYEDDGENALIPSPQLVYLLPAQRLQENRRYAVAWRDVSLLSGGAAQPTAAFAALRDGVPTTAQSVEDQRPRYEEMFAALSEAGVERSSLIQAWTFHTASGEAIRGPLLAMRDDGLARIDAEGVECTVESVEDTGPDENGEFTRRVDGTFRIPLYMDSALPPARAVRDERGLPQFQGWATAPFAMTIPSDLLASGAAPGRLVVYGHGLMGSGSSEGAGGYVRGMARDHDMVFVATDWQGMSNDDVTTVATALSDVTTFPRVTDRLMQGVLNGAVMARSFSGACKELPEALSDDGDPVIAEGKPYYIGISQGGIMGATLLTVSPDIERGALLVGAANYPLMMARSVDFHEYELIYRAWYPRRIDREILMKLLISLWDGAEPNAWLPYLIAGDPAQGIEPNEVLYQVSREDSQVPNLASDWAVRTMGTVPLMDAPVWDTWGLQVEAGPLPSAYVQVDTLKEPNPAGNMPAEEDNGAHGAQRYVESGRLQIDAFLHDGALVQQFCDGPCDPD